MGQKTNPNILRLGKTQNWKSKYFEKKSTETGHCSYNDLEIRKFISIFFNNNGLIIENCKINYSENTLHLFISYYSTFKIKTLILKNKINKNQNNKLTKKKNIKVRRTQFLKLFKKYPTINRHRWPKNTQTNSFLKKFFISLHLFLNKKINIFLTLYNLNKNLNKRKLNLLKKNLGNLRKYRYNEFFKKGLKILFLCASQPKLSNLLTKFIATQLAKTKRHNFFLRFIKTTLTVFNKKTRSNIKSIKIKIKGRLNGAPRARSRTITIGNGIPALTLAKNISYSENTAYTSNGTLGIKVWIYQ